MIISKDSNKHITIGRITLFIPDYHLDFYFFVAELASEFGVHTNTKAGELLKEKIQEKEEGLLDRLTFEYSDGGICVQDKSDDAGAILQVIFLIHDLMIPPYQLNLSDEDKNKAIEFCNSWVRPDKQIWSIGDVFTIPLMNEDYAYGQVIQEREDHPVCVLFECCSEEILDSSYVVTQRPISVVPLMGDKIGDFTFQVIGNAPVLVTGEGAVSEYEGRKVNHFSDSYFTSLANAYYRLTDWDDSIHDYNTLLLPGIEGPYDHNLRPVPNTVIDVIPGERIGNLRLGMSEAECSEVLEVYRKEYIKGRWHYSINDALTCIDFDEQGNISFIEMVTGYDPQLLQVLIHLPEQKVDAFHTKANTLIPIIDEVSPYDRSEESPGFAYYFKELGLALWRGNVFEEEQMNEAWYQEMCVENQQDELRFLYFETVSVMTPGYYG